MVTPHPALHAVTPALVALALILSGCGPSQVAPTNAPSSSTPIDPSEPLAAFDWLAGHWVSASEDATSARSEEIWMRPRGGTMIGMNRTATTVETRGFEFLRLVADADGSVLLASPGGRTPPTEFRCVENEGERAVFENLAHDFPQRIIYRRVGNELQGRIEGQSDDGPASTEWSWQLVTPLTR